ncbi:MAG: hypothetical protein K5989_03825, partial [Lachnospiraceae bacterium]|nr:hypothetical protein [Lachnospiraceae bacterium]
ERLLMGCPGMEWAAPAARVAPEAKVVPAEPLPMVMEVPEAEVRLSEIDGPEFSYRKGKRQTILIYDKGLK